MSYVSKKAFLENSVLLEGNVIILGKTNIGSHTIIGNNVIIGYPIRKKVISIIEKPRVEKLFEVYDLSLIHI